MRATNKSFGLNIVNIIKDNIKTPSVVDEKELSQLSTVLVLAISSS